MKKTLVALSVVGLLPLQGIANQIEKKDKWVLTEVASGGSTICVASTEDKGLIRTYTLKIQKVKNSTMPVEIFLHEKGKANYGVMATSSINNEVLLLNQFAIEEKSQTFWHLPDETKLLIDHLKTSSKNFEVRPYADLKGNKLSFSLKGAAHILAAMEKHCNNSKPLVDERVSALTNHSSTFDQAPKFFAANNLTEIRSLFYELSSHHQQLLLAEESMVKLVAQYKPQITERDSLKNEQSDLSLHKIPSLKQSIQSTTAKIENAEKRIVQLQNEIPTALKQKEAAQSKYDEASRQIAPHLPRHNQLVSDVNQARRSLSHAESEISSSQSEINQNTRQLQDLDREAQQLTNEIQNLRSDVSTAQMQFDRARRDYENFDSNFEIRRRLDSHSRYRTIKDHAERIRIQLSQEQEELRSLERDLTRARSQLHQCQSVPENNCEKLTELVNQLTVDVEAKRRNVSRIEGQYQSASREVESIENEIERDVRQEADQLRQAYNSASSRLSNLQSRLQTAEGERRDIIEFQIPRLRNRNDDLRNYVADLERVAAAERQNLRIAESELQRFDQSVGYSRLEQNLNSAQSALQAVSSAYSRLVNEDSSLKAQLPKDKAQLVQLNESLKVSEARLVQIGLRIQQLDQELVSFDRSKAEIEAKIATINSTIQSVQSKYMAFFQ